VVSTSGAVRESKNTGVRMCAQRAGEAAAPAATGEVCELFRLAMKCPTPARLWRLAQVRPAAGDGGRQRHCSHGNQ
jgi:hypothetical protein